jgi:hypothetical protein
LMAPYSIIDGIIWQFKLWNFGNCKYDGEYWDNRFINPFDHSVMSDCRIWID